MLGLLSPIRPSQAFHVHLPLLVIHLINDHLLPPTHANKIEELSLATILLGVKDEKGLSYINSSQLLLFKGRGSFFRKRKHCGTSLLNNSEIQEVGIDRIVCIGFQLQVNGVCKIINLTVEVGENYSNGSGKLTRISSVVESPLVHKWDPGGLTRDEWNPSGTKRNENIQESDHTSAMECHEGRLSQYHQVLFLNFQQVISFIGYYGDASISSMKPKNLVIMAVQLDDEDAFGVCLVEVAISLFHSRWQGCLEDYLVSNDMYSLVTKAKEPLLTHLSNLIFNNNSMITTCDDLVVLPNGKEMQVQGYCVESYVDRYNLLATTYREIGKKYEQKGIREYEFVAAAVMCWHLSIMIRQWDPGQHTCSMTVSAYGYHENVFFEFLHSLSFLFDSRVHPVFHVSLLKPTVFDNVLVQPLPAYVSEEMELRVQPEEVLAMWSC